MLLNGTKHLFIRMSISMGMIVYMCMSIYMHMSAFIIILMDVLIIYLISTYVFKTYVPLSTFSSL